MDNQNFRFEPAGEVSKRNDHLFRGPRTADSNQDSTHIPQILDRIALAGKGQPVRCIKAANRRKALPRWLIRCFSSAGSSAVVIPSSSTKNSGSYPNPPLPRDSTMIRPSTESLAVSI